MLVISSCLDAKECTWFTWTRIEIYNKIVGMEIVNVPLKIVFKLFDIIKIAITGKLRYHKRSSQKSLRGSFDIISMCKNIFTCER